MSAGAARFRPKPSSCRPYSQVIQIAWPNAGSRVPGTSNWRQRAGAVAGAESGVNDGDYRVAVDVHQRLSSRSTERNPDEDVIVRIASRVEQSWLKPLAWETVHGSIPALYAPRPSAGTGRFVVEERPTSVDPTSCFGFRPVTAWMERGPDEADRQLLQRAQFARIAIDTAAVVRTVAEHASSLGSMTLRSGLSPDVQRALDRIAPERLLLPSGRTVALEYGDGGRVTAAARLQELFGLAETPCPRSGSDTGHSRVAGAER